MERRVIFMNIKHFKNGTVRSLDDQGRMFSEFIVADGKIVATGDNVTKWLPLVEETIDCSGKFIFPAFIESHAHPLHYALQQRMINCSPSETSTINDLLLAVEEKVKVAKEGEWLIGFGWDESLMKEGRQPTIEELDEVAPNNPLFLKRTCVHNAVANSKAFEVSGLPLTVENPKGGKFERKNGVLTGLVQENAMDLFKVPPVTIEDQKKCWEEAERSFLSWGLTTLHDMAITKEDLKVYQQLHREGNLNVKIRLWLWANDQMGWIGVKDSTYDLGIESHFGDDYLSIQGMKFMLDGSVGGRTAAVAQPYENSDGTGILYMDADTIQQQVETSIAQGLRVAIHGIGERAIEMALRAIESAASTEQNIKSRHRIEHVALATEEQLKRMAEEGIVAASSTGFIYSIGDSYLNNLGSKRAARVFPNRTMRNLGVLAPNNSDFPVCDGNPLLGIYAAVTRKTLNGQSLGTEECLTVDEAFRSYTIDAAKSGCDERLIGSLEVGKHADFIMFERDPYNLPPEQLKDLKVQETYVAGECLFNLRSE